MNNFNIYIVDLKRFQVDRTKTLGQVQPTKLSTLSERHARTKIEKRQKHPKPSQNPIKRVFRQKKVWPPWTDGRTRQKQWPSDYRQAGHKTTALNSIGSHIQLMIVYCLKNDYTLKSLCVSSHFVIYIRIFLIFHFFRDKRQMKLFCRLIGFVVAALTISGTTYRKIKEE